MDRHPNVSRYNDGSRARYYEQEKETSNMRMTVNKRQQTHSDRIMRVRDNKPREFRYGGSRHSFGPYDRKESELGVRSKNPWQAEQSYLQHRKETTMIRLVMLFLMNKHPATVITWIRTTLIVLEMRIRVKENIKETTRKLYCVSSVATTFNG